MVIQVCDSVNLFIPYKLCNLLRSDGFIYHVRKFRNDNTCFAIRQWSRYLLPHVHGSCRVLYGMLLQFLFSKNTAPVGKSGPFTISKKLFDRRLSVFLHSDIVDDLDNGIDHLTQVVRRDIGCHTNGDTCVPFTRRFG